MKDRHPEAQAAYAHVRDLLRNDYGINIEDIHRDHPTALTDQHRALRDALDDYFAKKYLDAEADETLATAHGTNTREATSEAGELREATDEAHEREEAHHDKAEHYGAEVHQDRTNAMTEEHRPAAEPYGGSTAQGLAKIRETAGADVAASREKQAQGFPQSPENQIKTSATRRPARRAGIHNMPGRKQESGRTR